MRKSVIRKLSTISGLVFIFWLIMSSMASVPSAASQPSSLANQVLGGARLSLIRGDVVIQTKDTGSEWGAATINTPLIPGTKLWDPDNGRSEIHFSGGSYLRASENTEVDITNLSMGTSGDIIQVGDPQGRIYVSYAGSNGENSVFQIDTPVTSVMSYEPSKFEVDVYEDGYTEVSVFSGRVYVQNQEGSTRVDGGTMLSTGSNQNAELSPTMPEDAWISWNLSRDSALPNRGPSRRYLPGPLNTYSSDFDTYGRWVHSDSYGYVWTPSNIAVDWAPYRIGRWCWIGGDYVWVSYEPWGWVPYHYGRWAFVGSIGWCWVPPPVNVAVSWCPGFVAWIHSPTYVSWVPLAPGEIYYGYGYYGPNSVNIRKVNINRINITNVYVNARVTNSVTVVSRETFLTGRRAAALNAPANPFLAGVKIAIGRPDIKPVKATALPDPVKAVPQRVLPPKVVQNKVEIVQHRAVGTKKDVSVFNPGERTRAMRIQKLDRPKPTTTVQKNEPVQLSVPKEGVTKQPGQKEEMGKPSERRRETGPSPTQRGMWVAPRFGEKPNAASSHQPEVGPSTHRQEMYKPQTQREVKPPVQKQELVRSPVQREQMSSPSTRSGGSNGTSAHREMGIVPPFKEQRSSPPSNRPEAAPQVNGVQTKRPPEQSLAKPPVQRTEPVRPPVHRQEKNESSH
jgi:hypothetical protein